MATTRLRRGAAVAVLACAAVAAGGCDGAWEGDCAGFGQPGSDGCVADPERPFVELTRAGQVVYAERLAPCQTHSHDGDVAIRGAGRCVREGFDLVDPRKVVA